MDEPITMPDNGQVSYVPVIDTNEGIRAQNNNHYKPNEGIRDQNNDHYMMNNDHYVPKSNGGISDQNNDHYSVPVIDTNEGSHSLLQKDAPAVASIKPNAGDYDEVGEI